MPLQSPPPRPPEPSLVARWSEKLGRAQHVAVAILLHVILALLLGTMVIFEAFEAEEEEAPTWVDDGIPTEFASAPPPDPMPASEPLDPAAAGLPASLPMPSTPMDVDLAPAITTTAPSALAMLPSPGTMSGPRGVGLPGGGGGPGGTGTGRVTMDMLRGFGTTQAFDGSLRGTFYDTKQTAEGEPVMLGGKKIANDQRAYAYYAEIANKGFSRGFKERTWRDFFTSPRQLFTDRFFIPRMRATEGPERFEVKVAPMLWFAHYQGQARAPFSGRFRFVGRAGETLMVLWDGKLVLDANHSAVAPNSSRWKPRDHVDEFPFFNSGRWTSEKLVFGDWINTVKGQTVDVDILIGERGGGEFYCFLLWEGPGAEGVKDEATGLMAFPIWTTTFGPAEPPNGFKPGRDGPSVIQVEAKP
ncbi:MAG: hypothetical protein AAGK14_14315 [Verrucomicrobiota bacterium]